jgi:hypothetical protein
MKERARGTRGGRISLVAAAAAILCLAIAGVAIANNLDLRTAQNAAKQVAKQECNRTTNCTGYGASNVHRVTHHKAVGKIFVNSTKNGVKYQCRQQVVLHLDHFTGEITYGLSHRKCTNLGPA